MRQGIATAGMLVLACGWMAGSPPAHAQMMNNLKAMGSSMGNGVGGLSMPSVGSASSGNIAGVLKYCMRNNYLGGGSGSGAASAESGLLGKLGGGTTSSSQYEAGNQGTLQTGQGHDFSLGGGSSDGSLKAKLTQKVCDQVLSHAKSLI